MRSFVLYFVAAISIYFAITACNSPYSFKNKGYFKISFPEKKYTLFDLPGYPYTFEYPVYGRVIKDTTFFDKKPVNDYWLNIDLPQLGGRIHISYKNVDKNNLDSLINDGFKMAYRKHAEMSTGIEDSVISTPNKVNGMYFSLSGNTATANQFFVTDSTKHFLRGALYFDTSPNADSLGIVNDFLKKDLLHLINTLKWR